MVSPVRRHNINIPNTLFVLGSDIVRITSIVLIITSYDAILTYPCTFSTESPRPIHDISDDTPIHTCTKTPNNHSHKPSRPASPLQTKPGYSPRMNGMFHPRPG